MNPWEAEALIADLRAQLDEKTAEVEILHEVAARVAAAPSTTALLQVIAEIAVRVTHSDSASIYVVDPQRNHLTLKAVHDPATETVPQLTLSLGEGITGWVAQELLPVALETEAYKDPRFKHEPNLRDQHCESFLSVPMMTRGEFIGVLNVKTVEPHSYAPRSVRLLQAVAAQAAAAVQGMRLSDRVAATNTQLYAISEVSRTITSNLYLEEILQLIVAMTADSFRFRICSIMLLDEERQELVIKATQSKSKDYLTKPNLKVGESVAGRAVQEGRVLSILDVKQAPEYRFPDLAEKEGLCSMVCVPLISRERSIGVLNCYTSKPKEFSDAELESLQTLANQAAIAIENAKLMVRSAIIQEMHHRVKNSLQTVASLLRLQMNRGQGLSPQFMLRESINRITSIAAVHDLLSKEGLDRVHLREIAQTILTLTGRSLLRPGQDVKMKVVGEDVSLPSSKASPLALILNELIQNAVEHGFADHEQGEISVRISREDSLVKIEVINDGDPVPEGFDPKQSESLGLQIVQSLTQNDLNGKFTLSTDDLTRATVVFTA